MITKIAHSNPADRANFSTDVYALSSGYYRIDSDDLGCIRENGRSDYYFQYIVHGKTECIINGKKMTAEKGDIVFYNYNDRQEYTHLAAFDTQLYWIHIGGKNAAALLNDIGITESTILHTTLNLCEYFENIIRELTYQNEYYHLSVAGNIFLILSNISRKYKNNHERLDYIISLMNNMENNNLTLDDYAQISHLSKSQFIRQFKQYTGQTPINYKNRIIIAIIIWYLENTDYRISEIAEKLNFDNIYYFSSMFKKQMGLSPAKYRDRYLGIDDQAETSDT